MAAERFEKKQGECEEVSENGSIVKDSKRSWCVCLGAIFLVGISMGITNCFGVLFVSLTREYHDSRTKIAWVGSFHFICYMGFCPLCGILTRYFTFRPVVLLGSILFCLGLLISSFVKDISVFYLTYGVIFGIGTCLVYMPCVIVVPFCFKKNLATVSGLVAGANSGFTMWCGPVYEYLIRQYGWRVTLRIVTLFFIPLAVSCALFPSKKQVPSEKQFGDFYAPFRKLMKSKGFLIWVLLMTLVYLGLFVPIVHLMSFCQDIGIPTYISVYNITLMCGMETLGKVVSGKLVDILNLNVWNLNILALLTLAVSITLLPLARTASHVFIFAGFYGFATGVQALCVLMISLKLSHPDDAKHAVTYLFGALSIPGGIGPVLAAWLFDISRSYHLAFFIAGGFFACAACLGTFIHLFSLRNSSISYDNVLTTKQLAT